MRRCGTALALALLLAVAACDVTSSPSPAAPDASPTLRPTAGASAQPRTAAPTLPTILALDPGRRPSGPWAVTFQKSGTEVVREVYVLAPACPEPACDIRATIQTYDGIPLDTGVFRHVDGTYRYVADSRDPVDCHNGFESIADGAIQISHTELVIAGYRPAGTAVVSVDIRGTRSVTIEPKAGNSCEAVSIDYVANGVATEFAEAPAATPKPPILTGSSEVKASYFGSGATVETYRVSGSSITQIISSIRANGPYSDWVKARAEALTRAVPAYRFSLEGAAGSCRVKIATRPAIIFKYTITLPSWSRPTGSDQATIRWWATEIQRVAAHEKHHVDLFRAGATRMSDAVATSTCANLTGRLAAIAKDVAVAQCEFDLREYGSALGLSLDSCVNR